MPKATKLDLDKATIDQIAAIAHHGDEAAIAWLWEWSYPQFVFRAKAFCRKYRHIDHDDLANSSSMHLPKILGRYNPSKGKFERYLKISIYRACQDELRKDDPLGVQIPQREHYPAYAHLSAFEENLKARRKSGSDGYSQVVEDGLARIDRGYENVPHSDGVFVRFSDFDRISSSERTS